MLLSAISVVPRIELTLAESQLPLALNIYIISSVFIAGFCKDYWGIDEFYNDLFNKDPKWVLIKALQHVRSKVETLSLPHVSSLHEHMFDKRDQFVNGEAQHLIRVSGNRSGLFGNNIPKSPGLPKGEGISLNGSETIFEMK
jgi:hypothetical protein